MKNKKLYIKTNKLKSEIQELRNDIHDLIDAINAIGSILQPHQIEDENQQNEGFYPSSTTGTTGSFYSTTHYGTLYTTSPICGTDTWVNPCTLSMSTPPTPHNVEEEECESRDSDKNVDYESLYNDLEKYIKECIVLNPK